MKDKIFEFVKKVQAISHTGVTYSKDAYALDNYNELLELSIKMIHEYAETEVKPYDIYKDVYYPTPQPCVRVVTFKNNKLLMVQEVDTPDGLWTLPGGWCDIGDTPKQAAIKEMQEETGYDVKITRLLAVMDRSVYQKSELYNVYNIIFLAEIVGGANNPNYEVNKVNFFDVDDLPEFSRKISRREFDIVYDAYLNDTVYFE